MTIKPIMSRSPLVSIFLGFGVALTTLALQPIAPSWADSAPPPPDQGAPSGRQRGGASRGDCLDYQDLTALVPVVDGVVWSQTQSANPTFFVYVPQPLTPEIPFELVVQDREDNYVFRRQLAIDAPAGILTLPTRGEAAALSPDEAYRWTVSVYCDRDRPSASVSVFGTIKRVAAGDLIEPASALSPAQQLDLAQDYAAAGLWHEALDLTLALYATEANNPRYVDRLTDLLEMAGLTEIDPLVPVSEVTE